MEDFLFPGWQMWTTMAMIGIAVVLYSLDRFSMELVSAVVLVLLLIFFFAFPVDVGWREHS